MMTLSNHMERQFSNAPVDAVRLTLQLTFQAIKGLTGDTVVLDPEQQARLQPKLGEDSPGQGQDRHILWRWITQGARLNDARDMEHFLEVATLAVQVLGSGVEEKPACPPPSMRQR